jgi:hypothetical protein
VHNPKLQFYLDASFRIAKTTSHLLAATSTIPKSLHKNGQMDRLQTVAKRV